MDADRKGNRRARQYVVPRRHAGTSRARNPRILQARNRVGPHPRLRSVQRYGGVWPRAHSVHQSGRGRDRSAPGGGVIARASRPGVKSWTTMSDFSAFAEMERRSWSDTTRASAYVALFASAPDQAIESLLDAAGAERDLKALDLCCGQGNVSEALLSRGCERGRGGFFAGNAGARAQTDAKCNLY